MGPTSSYRSGLALALLLGALAPAPAPALLGLPGLGKAFAPLGGGTARGREEAKGLIAELRTLTGKSPKNGIDCPAGLAADIDATCRELERLNPTSQPANSPLMAGFWRMLYTDFTPAAPSSGKLGPFVGDVYQDLRPSEGLGKNILSIGFPPIKGALVAAAKPQKGDEWEITFDRVGNTLAGAIPFGPKIKFDGSEVRIWKITYLDEDFRILRARRPEASEAEAFVFIFERKEEDRFDIDV